MEWFKAFECNLKELVQLAHGNRITPNRRIVAKYLEEPDGIILLAKDIDQLIDMVNDTVPKDAMFEIWETPDVDDDPKRS